MPHFLLSCSVIHSQMKCIWKHLEWYSVQIISIIWCLLSWNQNPSICSLLSVLFTSLSCPRVSHAGRATETGPGSCIVQCTRVPGSHAGVMSWYCPTTNCQQQKVLLLTFHTFSEDSNRDSFILGKGLIVRHDLISSVTYLFRVFTCIFQTSVHFLGLMLHATPVCYYVSPSCLFLSCSLSCLSLSHVSLVCLSYF